MMFTCLSGVRVGSLRLGGSLLRSFVRFVTFGRWLVGWLVGWFICQRRRKGHPHACLPAGPTSQTTTIPRQPPPHTHPHTLTSTTPTPIQPPRTHPRPPTSLPPSLPPSFLTHFTFLAMASAVKGWSPVIIMTRMPAFLQRSTASGTPFLGGSMSEMSPTKQYPSCGIFSSISLYLSSADAGKSSWLI
jgi:hypothetical protein